MKIIISRNIKVRTTALFLSLITLLFSLSSTPISAASNQSVEEANAPVICGRLEEAMKGTTKNTKFQVMMEFTDDSNNEISSLITKELGMSEMEWKLSLSDETTLDEIHQFKLLKAKIASEIYTRNNNSIAQKHLNSEEIEYISRYSPVIIASLSADKINSLAKSGKLVNVDLFTNEMEPCTIEEQASRITDAKTSYSCTGEGINVGIFDVEVPDTNDIPECNYMDDYGANWYTEEDISHAELMATIIINIAPDANYYFAGGGSGITNYAYIEWMIDNAVDVINMSLGVGAETSTYTTMSKWFDHISYQHYITFVTSVGNKVDGIVGLVREAKMAYNLIAVGGIDTNGTATNYSDDFQAGTIYSTSTSFSVPFKPDICAPYGDSSQSSALIAGVVALLMGENVTLTVYSEAIKAILTACVNTSSPFRYLPKDRSTDVEVNSYMQFGAGLIDAYLSLGCADADNYLKDLILYTTTYKTYTFTVTSTDPVRISLAFLQPVEITSGSHTSTANLSDYNKIDLDLRIKNSTNTITYTYSTTKANNIEIVTFNPPSAGTYTIHVSRYGSQSEDSVAWYSVAWYQ